MTPSRADRSCRPGRPPCLVFDCASSVTDLCGTSDDRSYAVPRHCRQQPSRPPVNRGPVFLLAAMGAILLNAPPRDQGAAGENDLLRYFMRHGKTHLADTSDGCPAPQCTLKSQPACPSAAALDDYISDGRRLSLADEPDRAIARNQVIDVDHSVSAAPAWPSVAGPARERGRGVTGHQHQGSPEPPISRESANVNRQGRTRTHDLRGGRYRARHRPGWCGCADIAVPR